MWFHMSFNCLAQGSHEAFGLTIGLGPQGHHSVMFEAQVDGEFSEFMSVEWGSIIGSDRLRDSKDAKYLVQMRYCRTCCC